MSIFALLSPTWYKNLHEQIDITCDGVPIQLPDDVSFESLQIINIPSMYGGYNLWGEQTSDGFAKQHFADGLIEVVSMDNSTHVREVMMRTRSTGRRLAQGATVVIRTRKLLPMLIDGAAWMQPPCTVRACL